MEQASSLYARRAVGRNGAVLSTAAVVAISIACSGCTGYDPDAKPVEPETYCDACQWWSGRDALVARWQSWLAPEMWEERPCRVISAGISCDSGRDVAGSGSSIRRRTWGNRNVCGLKDRDVQTGMLPVHPAPPDTEQTPLIFSPAHRAACPGTYFCAIEEEWCQCDGTVTFSPALMDTEDYVNIDTAIRVNLAENAADRVRCDIASLGGDPAAGQTKYCWCTPQAVLEELPSQLDETMSSIEQCAKDSNNEYANVAASELAGLSERHGDASDDADDDLDAEVEHLTTPHLNHSDGRRLHTDGRRRHIWSYTPWAYVEVQPSTGKPEKRCVYQYGTARVQERYENGQPGSPILLRGHWGAGPQPFTYVPDVYPLITTKGDTHPQQWLQDWQVQGSKCWVRKDLGGSRGKSGPSLQTCAISMGWFNQNKTSALWIRVIETVSSLNMPSEKTFAVGAGVTAVGAVIGAVGVVLRRPVPMGTLNDALVG